MLTSKSVEDIALMRAILPVFIPICTERLFAVSTDKAIFSFTIDLIQIGIPPLIPALIRAELLLFSSVVLYYNRSTT